MVAHLPWYISHIPSHWCLYLHATVLVLGLDETFFGNFSGPKNEAVPIAPSGPLGPGWGLTIHLIIDYKMLNKAYLTRHLCE